MGRTRNRKVSKRKSRRRYPKRRDLGGTNELITKIMERPIKTRVSNEDGNAESYPHCPDKANCRASAKANTCQFCNRYICDKCGIQNTDEDSAFYGLWAHDACARRYEGMKFEQQAIESHSKRQAHPVPLNPDGTTVFRPPFPSVEIGSRKKADEAAALEAKRTHDDRMRRRAEMSYLDYSYGQGIRKSRKHRRKSHKRKSHKRKSHKRKSHKRKSHKRKSRGGSKGGKY